MTTIEQYSTSNGGVMTSTSVKIYTQEEYEEMLEAGTWTGGNVEGIGYVMAELVVNGSLSIPGFDFSDDSWDDPFDSGDDFEGEDEEPIGTGGGNNNGGGNSSGNNSGSQSGGGQGNNNSSDVLQKSNFRGYKPSQPKGCLLRCKEMLATVNCMLNGQEIAIMNYDSNGRATTPTSRFDEGIDYINEQLAMGRPVVVAVDYKDRTSMGNTRADQAGDHFVVIVGGSDSIGYHYFDPNTQSAERGTSSSNVFVNSDGKFMSTNRSSGSVHYYIMTSVRENQ